MRNRTVEVSVSVRMCVLCVCTVWRQGEPAKIVDRYRVCGDTKK